MESIVAITIVAVGLLGMFSLLSRSISLNRVISDRYVAANLAGEGIEVVKNIIDTNILSRRPWNGGLDSGNYEVTYNGGLETYLARKLVFNPNLNLYDYDVAGNPTNFIRRVAVERLGRDQIRVNSRVDWISRGGAEFSVELEDHFFNWQ